MDECVICGKEIKPKDSGLCDEHKYDEQAMEKHVDAVSDHIIGACVAYAHISVAAFYDWIYKNRDRGFLSKEAAMKAFWEEYDG